MKPDFYLAYHVGIVGQPLETFYSLSQARDVFEQLINAVGPENVVVKFDKIPESFAEFMTSGQDF